MKKVIKAICCILAAVILVGVISNPKPSILLIASDAKRSIGLSEFASALSVKSAV